ncbi:vps15 protein kinase [Plasmopara halstedii]|uniref:non-specific serine/threonine protein kinase n=1 Tax=Plasmopara halstedii TaxID=4781 RepID=A0A0P1AGI3_PLAHL|nr:vps15 protein kinase [Plasmopara halstedii]CEG40000.1 vps15 protein kinase [Plasmopara halstedii]|eukprot:XP_024576369.1 vps15 protein kinase [Plasmopara halstedii]
MGNAAPRAQPQSVLDSASQYRTFLMDYTPRSMDMMFGSLIGDGKFLKSISCKCDEGHLVVKIYRKYDERESLTSAEVALRRLALAFSVEQQPNVIPYADFQLSNKYNVAFMVRQYFASNLYDRICSRPFLTMVEKKWIAFQILRALEQSHAKGICHGDVKQENVMVTSWNWVFLTDFAPFKPTYIPEDDPADYNYYFCAIDATRRGCSVAPERFYGKGYASSGGSSGSTSGPGGYNAIKAPDAAIMLSKMADSDVSVEEVDKQILAMGMGSGNMAGVSMQTSPSTTSNGNAPSSYSRSRREGSLLESMDIFSAGCVIAELFLGGKPLFDLPSLLKYRRTGDIETLKQQIKKVGDCDLEEMLLHMLQLDPSARNSASGYLSKYTSLNGLFPTYFDSFLFRFLVLVLSRGGKVPDARIRLVCKYYGRLVREIAGLEDPEGEEFFKLRLKEGYGSDRLATASGSVQQNHVAQRVLEELYQKIPAKHDKYTAERDNVAVTKLQKIKDKENDMRGLSSTMQKKKIEKLHDQFNALTLKKNNLLLLDYARMSSTIPSDENSVDDAELKGGDEMQMNGSSVKANMSTPPPHSSKTRRMKPPTNPANEPWPHDRNGIVIVLSLICSSLRHVQVPESKLTALYLIRALGQYTSDEARLQRLIPYLLEVIDDPSATVRALALRTITYLLSLVKSFPLADASVFPQYVLPAMVPFQSDPDELVRITFAECLPQLAETSRRFLELAHAMKQKTSTSSSSAATLAGLSNRSNETSASNTMYMASSSFDKELSVLHKMISRFVIQLTTPDQKASSSLVKRALLVDITRLCVFFGQERTLDVVLPQLITFLNDPDWELRGAFFDAIVGVCSFVGPVAVEQNILPCIEQALFDVQEIVITKAVECLTGLCQLGLFQKKISTLVEKVRMTCSLLLHPSWWIRYAVLKLMGEIAYKLRSVDANVFLSPLLRPFLRKMMVFLPGEDVSEVTKRLCDCCRPYVSRETFDRALLASSSSSGLDDVIAELEQSIAQASDESDDDASPPTPMTVMSTTSRESLNEPVDELLRLRKNRDALLSSESTDGYGMLRQHSSGAAVASSAAVTTETIPTNGVASIYDHRKNEIQSLKLIQQYVSIASMQMRSKLELAKTEQAARMQGSSRSDRTSSPHGAVTGSSVTIGSGAIGTTSNPFARKLSRSHLRVLFVPDMRFALSTAQPLKAFNFGNPASSHVTASSNATSTTATSNSTALVTRSRSHAATSSPSHFVGSATSVALNGGHVPSLESLSLTHVGRMYSLVEPSTPISTSSVTVSGPSSIGSISSSIDESGLSHVDSNHFAPTSGGVMVSMLNMNMRDMYGGDAVNSMLETHHHSVHASPVSPPRQRMMKKAHTTYHHYFAFKESAMDPALGNPRKLLARLNALGIPPLPPDLGALRLTDGSLYSIYSHASSPYCLIGNSGTGSFGAGVNGAPGSERGGASVTVASTPGQGGNNIHSSGGGNTFTAAVAVAAAINGGVTPANFGGPSSSNGAGSTSGGVNGAYSGNGYHSLSRNWQPRKSVLVAELAEHSGAVTRVNAAQDYSFLASASNDGTVKIWSVRSLQHSVNQGSRCTYDGQGGVITDMKVLTNSHSVASASSDGTVHVFRVDKVNSVGGNVQATGIKELRANKSAVMAIDYLNNVTEALLLYATRDGKVHAWDLRMRREAWTLSISPELGYVTCITHSLDVSWLAVGTSRGFLCLWDLRFLVLIRIWRHSSHYAIHRIQPCLGLPNTLPLDETSVPLVFVAAGDGEVAVFDLSIGACRAVFRTLDAQASEAEACKCPTLLHVPIPHRSRSVLGSFLGILGITMAFDEISSSSLSEEPSVRAMLYPSLHVRGIGDALITGGEDRQLRYWDIRNGKQSYTICGNEEAKSFYDIQAPPSDWWRMNSGAISPLRYNEMPAAPMSTTAAITKPELAWSKLSPPLITVCQDSSFYSGAAASSSDGVESAISMERRGLVPPSPAHTDCILDLTLVELGTSQNLSPMLVSSGRDALIKVWK